MAVFTQVSFEDMVHWLKSFDLGDPVSFKGISSGIENSNFFVNTTKGEYVLTVFERLTQEELPFYVYLMKHLASKGIRVPEPLENTNGQIIHSLHDKPACIVTKLEGYSIINTNPEQCSELGRTLAKMHLAAQDFSYFQPNTRSIDWWRKIVPVVDAYIPRTASELMHSELSFQESYFSSPAYKALTIGPVHCDLFRNNVMFVGNKLSGVFDFYFAGCDTWLYDIAVALNDWCINLDNGEIDFDRARALLDAYHSIRPFTQNEALCWRSTMRSAAFRFWLSRLYDYYLPREADVLTPHDPMHFERILRLRINNPLPRLFNE